MKSSECFGGMATSELLMSSESSRMPSLKIHSSAAALELNDPRTLNLPAIPRIANYAKRSDSPAKA